METTLLGLNTHELSSLLVENGQPFYRGKQLAEWIYRRGAHTFAEMTTLPASFRNHLDSRYKIRSSTVVSIQSSKDGSTKLLLNLKDGAKVETVGLPYSGRFSCCLSTQVGCAVGCVFCATGSSGFLRNLSAGEIVEQVLAVQSNAKSELSQNKNEVLTVDHAIFMGMGEPLLNYDSTVKALYLLNNEFGISMRHLTLSTVGYVPRILDLAKLKLQITLAISLHAPGDELRRKLIPGMPKYCISEIIAACSHYVEETGRRVTFEYCLLDGVNDTAAEATELARILKGLNCHVNLIIYNPIDELPYQSPTPKTVRTFRAILERCGIQVTQRLPRGSDIDAACGQLRRRVSAS